MISYLQGTVKQIYEKSLTLLVGGVGYHLFMTSADLSQLAVGQEKELFVHTVVKEDAFDLYGFTEEGRYHFFKLLITISGIGPRSGLNILDAAGPDDIRQAVINDDPGLLQKVNGIGKKTAERIVVELKSKIGAGITSSQQGTSHSDVLEALESLGYKAPEIRAALQQIDSSLSTEKQIGQILKLLGR